MKPHKKLFVYATTACAVSVFVYFAVGYIYHYAISRSVVNAIHDGDYEYAFDATMSLPVERRIDIDVMRASRDSPEYLRYLLDRWCKYEGGEYPMWAVWIIYNSVAANKIDPSEVSSRLRVLRERAATALNGNQLDDEMRRLDSLERVAVEVQSRPNDKP